MSDAPQGPGWWQASDGRWYPPQAPTTPPPPQHLPPPAPGAYPAAAPKQEGMSGCLKAFLIVLALLVVGGIATFVIAVFLIGDKVNDFVERQEEAQDDARIVDCDLDDFGSMSATVEITNDSRGESDYTVTVAFHDDENDQITSSVGFANGLDPGQRTEIEVRALEEPAGDFTCEIDNVFRISSEFGD